MQQHSRKDLIQRMQSVSEGSHHAEICPGATDRPEQIGVHFFTSREHFAVRSHYVYGQQVVASGAVLSHQIAKAAPERQTGNSRVGNLPSRRRQTVRLSRAIEL